jgi:hypothetical protein
MAKGIQVSKSFDGLRVGADRLSRYEPRRGYFSRPLKIVIGISKN